MEGLGDLDEVRLLFGDLGVLGLEAGELLGERFSSQQGLAGEVLIALLEGGLGLTLELVALLLELGGLQLDALA